MELVALQIFNLHLVREIEMATSEEIRILGKIAAPIGLVISPLWLIILTRAVMTTHEHLSVYMYFKGFGFGVFGLLLSFWYCRKYLGWFRKKND